MRNIEFGRPMISQLEKDAVMSVLDSPQLVHGPITKDFENIFSGFLGGGFSTSTSSATTALQLAYMVLGISPGDEVIVTSLTHVATANSIRAVGAIPVFVDVEVQTGNISVEQIQRAITSKTKAICVVHYLGLPVEMNRILSLAKSHNLFVIEDCALALGSYYQGTHVGLVGDFGAFSFYPAKHITTGEGGMLVSKNQNLIETAMKMKAFHYSKNVGDRKVPGLYDILGFGLNLRMSEISAAIGIEQIKKLPNFLRSRKENIDILTFEFESRVGSFLDYECGFGVSGIYCAAFVLRPEFTGLRDDLIMKLKKLGISCSIYYPVSLPRSTYYRTNPQVSRALDTPNSDYLSTANIAFGVGPHLSLTDMKYVRETFSTLLKGAA